MASEAIFHNLPLLLHSIGLEGLHRFSAVPIWAGADSHSAMEQIPQLGDEPPAEVHPGSPLLVLAAVGQLVRQDRQVSLTSIRQKHVISERHRSITADPQYGAPKHPCRAGSLPAI